MEQLGAAGRPISAGGNAAEPHTGQTGDGWKQHSQWHAQSHRWGWFSTADVTHI